MIYLNPASVKLGTFDLTNVFSIALDREARRLIEEWTDLGPFENFADVPEQRVSVWIARRILATETSGPKPGESHALSFRAADGADASSVRSVSMTVVVTAVEHTLSSSGRATQRIRGVAVSTTGSGDPVTETLTEGEV